MMKTFLGFKQLAPHYSFDLFLVSHKLIIGEKKFKPYICWTQYNYKVFILLTLLLTKMRYQYEYTINLQLDVCVVDFSSLIYGIKAENLRRNPTKFMM